MPCPNGVSIPDNFGVYNDFFTYDDPAVARAAFQQMKSWQGPNSTAASCVGCGICEEKCPQKIAISELMPKAAEIFAKNHIE
jgi:predicted aldo/keto reductase-like oxidoreductase